MHLESQWSRDIPVPKHNARGQYGAMAEMAAKQCPRSVGVLLLGVLLQVCVQAQELRLSNDTIAENLPAGTEVGRFFSDSFDAKHYLPGVHALAASGDYLYSLEDSGELWVLDVGRMGGQGKKAPVPTQLMDKGVTRLGMNDGNVVISTVEGVAWKVDLRVMGALQDRKVLPDLTMLDGEEAEEAKRSLAARLDSSMDSNVPDGNGQESAIMAKGNNWVASIHAGENDGLWVKKVGRGSLPNEKPVKIERPGTIFRPAGTDNYLFQVSGSRLVTRRPLDFEDKGEHQIFVHSTDSRGRDVRKSFTIKVTNKPEAPTNILPWNGGNFQLPENSPKGTVVDKLRIVDPDKDEMHAIELMNGSGEAVDNGFFGIRKSVDGSFELYKGTEDPFDFESKASFTIRLKVSDKDGLHYERSLAIQLTDENEPPLPPELDARPVAANTRPGTLLGILRTEDPDAQDSHTFTVLAGDDGEPRFSIHKQGASGDAYLQTAMDGTPLEPADYEIEIQVQDKGGLSATQTFVIPVGAPLLLELETIEIPENARAGQAVGQFDMDNGKAVPMFTGIRDVAIYGESLLYVKGDGSLWSETGSQSEMLEEAGVQSVSAGDGHFVYTKEGGTVFGKGDNSKVQLGAGQAHDAGATARVFDQLVQEAWAVGAATYAHLEDGQLLSLGETAQIPGALLGTKVTPAHSYPHFKHAYWIRGDGSLWRSKYHTGACTLITPSGVQDFVATEFAMFILETQGQLRVWDGADNQKQLLTDIDRIEGSSSLLAARSKDGSLWKVGPRDQAPQAVAKSRVMDFDVSGTTIAYSLYDGSVWSQDFEEVKVRTQQHSIKPDAIVPKDSDNHLFTIEGNQLLLAKPIPRDKDTLQIQVLARAADGRKVEKEFTLYVHEVEEPPDSIQVSEYKIPEDTPGGKSVGKLTATDPDEGDEATFKLVPPREGRKHHNHLYEIEDHPGIPPMLVLKENTVLNHETQPVHAVYIQATDSTGLHFIQSLKIKVTNVSEPPASIHLDQLSIPQNLAAWARAATISAIDDPGDSPHFELVEPEDGSPHDNALFEIHGDGLLLKSGSILHRVMKPTLEVWVRATGEDKQYLTQKFTITVTPPVPLSLDNLAFPENLTAGAAIGNFQHKGSDKPLKLPGIRGIAAGNGSYYYIDSQSILWENRLQYAKHPTGPRLARPARPKFIATSVRSVSAGDGHTYFTKKDGSLWGFGSNMKHQLGKQAAQYSATPVKLFDSGIDQVFAAQDGGFMLGKDGSLWFLGTKPGFGQPVQHPERILPSGVKEVASGARHSLILMKDGSLWSMGQNGAGQLGAPHANHLAKPTKVKNGPVASISAINDYSLFCMADGTVWHMGTQAGENRYGSARRTLPTPLPAIPCTRVYAGTGFNLLLHQDGSVSRIHWNPSRPGETIGPAQLLDSGAEGLAGFVNYNIVWMADGTIWEFDHQLNQKGFGEKVPNYTNTVPGPQLNHNPSLDIQGNQLVLAQPSQIRGYKKVGAYVHAITPQGHVTGHPFHLEAQEVPEAPTDILPNTLHLSENTPGGSKIAQLTATDPDPGELHLFQILAETMEESGQDDSRHFLLHQDASGLTTLHLHPDFEPDFETKNKYNLTIKVSDKDDLQYTDTLELHLVDVNEPPTELVLKNAFLPADFPPGHFIGLLDAQDSEKHDTHSFSLVPKADGSQLDNELFQIQGRSMLLTSNNLPKEGLGKPTYKIHVQAKDPGGFLFLQEITVNPTPSKAKETGQENELPREEIGLEAKGGPVFVVLMDKRTMRTSFAGTVQDGETVTVKKQGGMTVFFDEGDHILVRIKDKLYKMPKSGEGRTAIP